ncbi:ArdC-like ssDNA-binding domain-containing protein, partial [Novosphingobium sp. TCA1]|uniref:ArdC-like ssDNA-binding domain-containing protein n=1 Tax=Novosphingobium sp. TCA1 TaxID=2682474 RepID=UPI00135CED22
MRSNRKVPQCARPQDQVQGDACSGRGQGGGNADPVRVRERGFSEGVDNPDHNPRHNPEGNLGGNSAGSPSAGRRDTRRKEARVSLYDEVTARIIAELEAGRVPWVQPWSSTACGGAGGAGAVPCLPRNALTSRSYSGINILLLWASALANGWQRPGWLTFRQAIAAGGNVRKG